MATAKKEPIPERPGYVKTEGIAQLLVLTPQRVRDLTRSGILKKHRITPGERYSIEESVHAYISYLRDMAKSKQKDESIVDAEKRKAQAEADLKRSKADIAMLQLNELEGKMHRSDDVEAVMTDLVYAIRSMLIALPGRLAVDVSTTTSAQEASEVIKREVYKILNELSEYKYNPEEYARRVREREAGLSMPMTKKNNSDIANLNATVSSVVKNFKPPEDLNVDAWAERYRRLPAGMTAEAGPWRTDRTPYLREPMKAFTDPKIHRIVMVSASQIGKSELELNIIGYIIAQDPGSILYVHPTIEDARKFSRLRVAPMIRESRVLRDRVSDIKSRDSGNTILQKSFPGGMLTITGSNSPSALASTPARYIIGDERDRWTASAGAEGDPWGLAQARQATFYNAKAVEVSTPTIKGASNIETSYYLGTQERWCHKCPECGEYHEIVFDNIKFTPIFSKVNGKKNWKLKDGVTWCCPGCGCIIPESVMRKQPAKWVAENPEAYEKGIRSFWLNAFSSPWTPWSKIALEFLDAKDDPERLKVVYNTLFGQLWDDRGDLEDEDTMLARRRIMV